MNRLLAPAALVLLVACDEPDPLSLQRPSYTQLATTSVLAPPVVQPVLDGNLLTLSWEWSDPAAWDRVGFAVARDGAILGIPILREEPYFAGSVVRRAVVDVVPGGTHTYCVTVNASAAGPAGEPMAGTGSACADVTLAPPYTIELVGGNAADGAIHHAANITLEYELHEGDALLRDCATEVAVVIEPATTIRRHHCNPDGTRMLVVRNPARGSASDVVISFRIGSTVLRDVRIRTS
jgi:hypothetical protein